MLRSLKIKNFRGFRELNVGALARVNLIAGRNNTGKTALLEAVYLHCNPNNCKLPVDVNEVRGVVEPARAFAELSGWLFHDKNFTEPLELSSVDTEGQSHSLAIWLLDPYAAEHRFQEMSDRFRRGFRQDAFDQTEPLLFLQYTGSEGSAVLSAGAMSKVGFCSINSLVPWKVPTTFLMSSRCNSPDEVRQFSELDVANRQAEVVASLKLLDERLSRLALVLLGDQPVIHGDVGLSRLVPLALMGEGVRRLLSFVLAIANTRGGIVLIDEIENGLHYSVLKKVWTAIAHAARQADVQVFATTHSWECIAAAHEAFKENGPYEFRYHRLDRRGEDIVVKSLDERMLDTVEATDLEVR
jgi:hypothetical protein